MHNEVQNRLNYWWDSSNGESLRVNVKHLNAMIIMTSIKCGIYFKSVQIKQS